MKPEIRAVGVPCNAFRKILGINQFIAAIVLTTGSNIASAGDLLGGINAGLQGLNNVFSAANGVTRGQLNSGGTGGNVQAGFRTLHASPGKAVTFDDNQNAVRLTFSKLADSADIAIRFVVLGEGQREFNLCTNPVSLMHTVMLSQNGNDAYFISKDSSLLAAGQAAITVAQDGSNPCYLRVLGEKTVYITPPFWYRPKDTARLHWENIKLDVILD